MTTPKIGFICASLRKDSINKCLENALRQRFKAAGVSTSIIDLAEYELPLFHGDIELPATVKNLVMTLLEFDGLVIVSPEYNGGLPPLLKNTIDWTSTFGTQHFTQPVYGIASCTPGAMSGIMCMRQINYILMRLGAEVLPVQVGVGNAAVAFDEDGHLVEGRSLDLADKMIAAMIKRIEQKSA
ncbi:NAD(P)H-dependent FMN reductase [Litorimonas taeanensis]|uniref:NAD(P)H-dependent FMN reductase n=1 Tax=Litorimonas taeanensis TaxID=568099 RepID=A0A420WEA9_9PROT|nr:NAD(P)H-dependent oxidoreductase [Litorimonas taeanensis]RKQ69357.1 NAD(P)H-dependent FMN reductase [Litorimonas taeanensis]